MPRLDAQRARKQPAPHRDHEQKQEPEDALDDTRVEQQQRARAQSRARHSRGAIEGVGAPVDLPPPHHDAREVGEEGGNRHDRYGLLRPEGQHQRRHQHDGGAEADDATERAGAEPERQDREPDHGCRSRRRQIGTALSPLARCFAANEGL